MTPGRWLSALACVVTLLLAVTGCGGDAPSSSAPAPATSPSTSPSGPATTSPEPSEPTEPEPVVPTVAPATGPLLTGPTVSVNAPVETGDTPTPTSDGGTVFKFENPRYSFQLRDVPWDTTEVSTLAEEALDAPLTGAPAERRPDVVIAGQPAYRVVGPDLRFDGWREEFGFSYADNRVLISVNTPRDVPQRKRDAMNAAVIASVELLR